MMGIIDTILLFIVSTVQSLIADLTRYERRYLKQHFAKAVEASRQSPQRADERFAERIIDVSKDIQKIGYSKTYVDFDGMWDDGLETLSAFLKTQRGVKKSYKSLRKNQGLTRTQGGPDFYAELRRQARDCGIDLIGFTQVPSNYIFKDKRILYPNAMVCAQEMKRADMETAPRLPASVETLRVYANLGAAMNRLADFIRSEGIPCQVSHPMIGLVLYTALASKAGLGYFGRQGLLITPEFGVRQRLGAILVPLEDMPWTDSDEHKWIHDFCDQCNLCIRRCPGQAIYEKVKPNVPGIYTSTNNKQCSPWFSLYVGCSICMKVCPFSRKPYQKLRQAFERREAAQVIDEETTNKPEA